MDNIKLTEKINELLERVVRIETKIDGYNSLREKLEQTYMLSLNNQKKIEEIKENNKWLWRTIIGTIIAIIVPAILKII